MSSPPARRGEMGDEQQIEAWQRRTCPTGARLEVAGLVVLVGQAEQAIGDIVREPGRAGSSAKPTTSDLGEGQLEFIQGLRHVHFLEDKSELIYIGVIGGSEIEASQEAVTNILSADNPAGEYLLQCIDDRAVHWLGRIRGESYDRPCHRPKGRLAALPQARRYAAWQRSQLELAFRMQRV